MPASARQREKWQQYRALVRRCPGCGKELVKEHESWYHCKNEKCKVISVKPLARSWTEGKNELRIRYATIL